MAKRIINIGGTQKIISLEEVVKALGAERMTEREAVKFVEGVERVIIIVRSSDLGCGRRVLLLLKKEIHLLLLKKRVRELREEIKQKGQEIRKNREEFYKRHIILVSDVYDVRVKEWEKLGNEINLELFKTKLRRLKEPQGLFLPILRSRKIIE